MGGYVSVQSLFWYPAYAPCITSHERTGLGAYHQHVVDMGSRVRASLTYVTTKAALNAFSKNVAIELAGTGITVNTVAPGSITFPDGSWQSFQENNPPAIVDDFIKNNLPMGRFGWPEPVGALVAYLASTKV